MSFARRPAAAHARTRLTNRSAFSRGTGAFMPTYGQIVEQRRPDRARQLGASWRTKYYETLFENAAALPAPLPDRLRFRFRLLVQLLLGRGANLPRRWSRQ